MIAALEGTGPPVAGEERLYDALGRAVAVRTTTPTGGASTVFHAWWGDTILSEEWAEGWRRDWYPGLGLDAPLGYRLDCSAGNCGLPPLGLGVEGAGLDANEPSAVFWTIQDVGRDLVAIADATGMVVERYAYRLYGHRTVIDAATGEACDDAKNRGCGSRFGNPLGHAGARRSDVTGIYAMRARFYAPAMRVFLSTDPLGYVDAFDRWLYVGGNPASYWDPFGLGMSGLFDPDEPTEGAGDTTRRRPRERDPYCVAHPGACDNELQFAHYPPPVVNEGPPLTTRAYDMVFGDRRVDPSCDMSGAAMCASRPARARVAVSWLQYRLDLPFSLQHGGVPLLTDNEVKMLPIWLGMEAATLGTMARPSVIIDAIPSPRAADGAATTPAAGPPAAGGDGAGGAARGGADVVRAGQAGEAAVRSVSDIGPKVAITVAGRARIPDGLNLETRVLSEVKNVGSLSYTQQLRDFAAHASANGLRLDLWVRPTTQLSGPLAQEVANGAINLRKIP